MSTDGNGINTFTISKDYSFNNNAITTISGTDITIYYWTSDTNKIPLSVTHKA